MAHEEAKVEFENERVKVTRVKAGRGEQGHHARTGARHDRLIVYLQDGHILRAEGGRKEEVRRKAGEVIWRPRSQHEIEYPADEAHEVLIIELKP